MSLPLLALALASFGIGTTEFVIMGLLPEVAADLGVTIPGAGFLVTGYALGVVIGAPIVAMATNGLPRKATLLGLMGIFILGNALCALAPGYGLLMAARVVTAFCHGAFFGIGAVVAANLVPRHQRASAIAMMFAGLTIANILGVPGGTALGQALDWRATFWAVAVIGVVAAAALALWLPRTIPTSRGNMLREMRILGRPQVMLAMGMSILSSASLFSVFTYIAPLLREDSGFAPGDVTWILVLFGIGITIGNIIGGRLADWRLLTSLGGIFAALALVLALFVFASQAAVPAIITVVLWGLIAFAAGAPLQTRVVDQAHEAPNLASTLNQAAFNLGNAGGAWLGGVAVTLGFGYAQLPWIGAALALMAMGLCVLSQIMERRAAAASLPAAAAPAALLGDPA